MAKACIDIIVRVVLFHVSPVCPDMLRQMNLNGVGQQSTSHQPMEINPHRTCDKEKLKASASLVLFCQPSLMFCQPCLVLSTMPSHPTLSDVNTDWIMELSI